MDGAHSRSSLEKLVNLRSTAETASSTPAAATSIAVIAPIVYASMCTWTSMFPFLFIAPAHAGGAAPKQGTQQVTPERFATGQNRDSCVLPFPTPSAPDRVVTTAVVTAGVAAGTEMGL
jgi:hypothetical protein